MVLIVFLPFVAGLGFARTLSRVFTLLFLLLIIFLLTISSFPVFITALHRRPWEGLHGGSQSFGAAGTGALCPCLVEFVSYLFQFFLQVHF